jgi:phenylacetate-CoA ligase
MTTPAETWIANALEIEQYRPQLYYVDPIHLAAFARYVRDRGFKPFPAPIVLTYSLDTQISRRQIIEAFGTACPVINVASMSELGWLAAECPNGVLHLNNSSYYLELLCAGRPAEPHKAAELIVTTLDHGATPRIRYRTRDVFSFIDTTCACGHDFPVVRLEGRLSDCIFRSGEVVLTPKGLDDLIGDPGWIDVYKLHQFNDERFLFQLVVNEKHIGADETRLVMQLRERLGREVSLDVEKVCYIPCEFSGKFAVCTSDVGRRLVNEGFTL